MILGGFLLFLAVGGCLGAEVRLTTLTCSKHTMNPGTRVIIQSPFFPANYPPQYRCQYEITCNSRESTFLRFICPSFNLESSPGCLKDRFIVTYKGFTTTKCGARSPNGIVTTDGWTRITFFSNPTKTARGFRCYIWCHPKATTPTTTQTTLTTPTSTATPTTLITSPPTSESTIPASTADTAATAPPTSDSSIPATTTDQQPEISQQAHNKPQQQQQQQLLQVQRLPKLSLMSKRMKNLKNII
ncbi:hypothetical protein SK128_005698 [Halocaridina rubra]|uniref:CUB domain-containing protein n=1 Tax=Halocaridina rubra TaxID=373956 RepID=A0AAN8X5A1_HALRR